MDEDLAEAPREGLVALGIELLVTEEDDAVVEQGLADVADGGLVQLLADVDVVNLGADGARDWADLDLAVAHGFPPGLVFCLQRGYGLPRVAATGLRAHNRMTSLPHTRGRKRDGPTRV